MDDAGPASGWTGTNVGGQSGVPVPGTLCQSAGAFTVARFGDIGPAAGLVAATLALVVGTPPLPRAGGLRWPVSLLAVAAARAQ